MKFLQVAITLCLAAIVVACSSLPDGARPVSSQYCDSFLAYDMCARDMSGDGVVDMVYFTDTLEVFMFRSGVESRIPSDLGLHRCARPMDDGLVATTSRLFYIDDSTSFIEKQDIRGAMLLKYISYMSEVSACNLRHKRAEQAGLNSSDGL